MRTLFVETKLSAILIFRIIKISAEKFRIIQVYLCSNFFGAYRNCPDYRGFCIIQCPHYLGFRIIQCPHYRGLTVSNFQKNCSTSSALYNFFRFNFFAGNSSQFVIFWVQFGPIWDHLFHQGPFEIIRYLNWAPLGTILYHYWDKLDILKITATLKSRQIVFSGHLTYQHIFQPVHHVQEILPSKFHNILFDNYADPYTKQSHNSILY